jgi:FG-GAP repeat protein
MRDLRLVLVITLLFSALANAQSGGARFSSLPSQAQVSISAALAAELPGSAWSQVAKLTASDGQSGQGFGVSAAISGNTVVVGISVNYLHEAYVFEKPASGWADLTQTAILSPSDGAYGFGYALGISGNTIVVGATGNGNGYVYVRPAGGWKNMTETAMLQSPSSGVFELGVSGNTVILSSAYNGGTSYVFVKPNRGWKSISQPNATLTTPYFANFCQWCVAVSGDTIAVGTPGSFGSEGTAYVFVKPTGGWQGTLNPTATLVASNGKFSDQMGISVAVSGNTVVAGANGDNQYSGTLYVFVKPSSGWRT